MQHEWRKQLFQYTHYYQMAILQQQVLYKALHSAFQSSISTIINDSYNNCYDIALYIGGDMVLIREFML